MTKDDYYRGRGELLTGVGPRHPHEIHVVGFLPIHERYLGFFMSEIIAMQPVKVYLHRSGHIEEIQVPYTGKEAIRKALLKLVETKPTPEQLS
jgi:hypothetical protein